MTTPGPQMVTSEMVANLVGGELRGSNTVEVQGLNKIEAATPNEITFVNSEKYAKFLHVTQSKCILVNRGLAPEEVPEGTAYILCDDAYRSFVRLMQTFFPPTVMAPGVRSSRAEIHPTATVHETASIGAGCVIAEHCVVGENTQMFANVVLYPRVHVGSNTVVHANVTLCTGTTIGNNCIIHSGVVVGADGFGFFENPDGSFEKIPQVGTVVVGNNVEIGANTCIDRAAVGTTTIEDGVKLDNLVHIAHGVHIGKNSAMAAQAGVSGSTRIGKRNRIAGQVGIVGHISTSDDVIVEAQSGVSKDVTSAGAYFGSPAKEHRTALKMEAALRRLPDMMREFQELKRELTEHKDPTKNKNNE